MRWRRTTFTDPLSPVPDRAASLFRYVGLVIVAALALLSLASCTQSTIMKRVSADALHGKTLLLLEPSLLAPTPPELQAHVVERVEARLAASREFGPITRGAELKGRDLPLVVKDAYEVFTNTLSVTGVSDPELSRRLFDGLNEELLVVIQPAYIPCSVCQEGDELWIVGQVVQARTGEVVVRVHLSTNVSDSSLAALQAVADGLSDECVRELERAFHLRPHRQRFAELKRMAAG